MNNCFESLDQSIDVSFDETSIIYLPTQEKSVTPSETAQEVIPDSGKTLSKVFVGAISKTYVGSDIARNGSDDITVNGSTVTVPAGYYDTTSSKEIEGVKEPYIEETYDDSGNLTSAIMHGYPAIRTNLFYSCKQLTSVYGLSEITSIGGSAFYNCKHLVFNSLPEGITSIGNNAFYGCWSLKLETLPERLTTIGANAFYNAGTLLTSLPASIVSIGNSAFENNTSLKTLTFEGTPTTISASAFNGCRYLTVINVPWAEGEVANAPWGATNATINYNYGK